MTPAYRLLPCALLLVLACGDSGNTTTAVSATETTTTGSTGSTSSTTDTTTTGSTTATPTSTGPTTSTTDTTTTGGPVESCAQHKDENACALAGCDWTQVIGYTHGTQGCNGSIRDFCVPKDTSGGLTSVWKDTNGDVEVVQFPFIPTDLDPEWKVCDCDGPLACLCTAAQLDCPERLEEFCSTITGMNGCTNAAVAGELACSWFNVSPEGPIDTMCTGDPQSNVCLPATRIGEKTCDPISLPYMQCQAWTQPVFWREVNGVVQVTTVCGPEPVGWTKCVADDPGQPEECKCRCL